MLLESNSQTLDHVRLRLIRRKLHHTLITGILMGLTWLFAFLAVDERSSNMSYAFSFFNAALAIWILIDSFFFDIEVRHRLEYSLSRNPSLLEGSKLSRSTSILLDSSAPSKPSKKQRQSVGSTGHFYPTNSRQVEDVTLMRGNSISKYTHKPRSQEGTAPGPVPMPSRLAEAFAGPIAETDLGLPAKLDITEDGNTHGSGVVFVLLSITAYGMTSHTPSLISIFVHMGAR